MVTLGNITLEKMILTAHEKLRRDDGFQLEKELDNSVSKDFRNMLTVPTSVESTASFITSIHPSKVA